MKRFSISTVSAVLALAISGAPLAMAQPAPNHGPQMSPHSDDVHPSGPQHVVRHTTIVHTTTTHGYANNTMPHQMSQPSHEAMGPAFSGHHWHHGDRYTGGRNYVDNWQSHHLSAPPSGYRWVQDGGQFVLIGVASGIIASVILDAAYQ